MSEIKFDTLVIGCGIAGATAALKLSEDPQRQIAVITRAVDTADSNSHWAQGGIVTRGLDDNPALLVEDILYAGAGLSSPQAAQLLADEGPRLVQKVLLEQCGVHFDETPDGEIAFGLEAAHSRRRVIHVGDKTGSAIMAQLLGKMTTRPNIHLLTRHTALDLIQSDHSCYGATILDREHNEVVTIYAQHTIMATGGVGQLYQRTTNPLGARGDGIAMAWRAGLAMQNMEFIQFHPTAMALDQNPLPLISEAVRGEGAILVNPDGEAFMSRYAPEWGDLAPRDVVARAIYTEMQENAYPHVFLDVAACCSTTSIEQRFPTLVENCRLAGIDPCRNLIPIVPAAHYFCGGIPVGEWGRTQLHNLFAIGEVSCTGLHGANRLASTSLLEGLVWGHRAAEYILHERIEQEFPVVSAYPSKHYLPTLPSQEIEAYLTRLQVIMWDKVGIIRTEDTLTQACTEILGLYQHIESLYNAHALSDGLVGLRNATHTALLIACAALENKTSLGAHYRQEIQKVLL